MAKTIGVLMLDTRFPRILGDVGHAGSYDCPVIFKTIKGATVAAIVKDGKPDPQIVARFVQGAKELEAEGATHIITSCGFLSIIQKDLQEAVSVPVTASALSLYEGLVEQGHTVGIITANKAALSQEALTAANIPAGALIEGLEGSKAFNEAILSDGEALDEKAIERDTVKAAQKLKAGGATAILLECANLPPYAEAIKRNTRLTALSLFDIIK